MRGNHEDDPIAQSLQQRLKAGGITEVIKQVGVKPTTTRAPMPPKTPAAGSRKAPASIEEDGFQMKEASGARRPSNQRTAAP